MTTKIRKLDEQRKKIYEALSAAVKEAFPIGCKVRAVLGGHEITGTVTGHGWKPDQVYFTNDQTGKSREASATYVGHDLTRVS